MPSGSAWEEEGRRKRSPGIVRMKMRRGRNKGLTLFEDANNIFGAFPLPPLLLRVDQSTTEEEVVAGPGE